MSFDYSKSLDTARKQIADKGRNVVYKDFKAGTYNPQSNTLSGGSDDETTIKAVMTSYKLAQIDGNVTRRDDKLLLVAADSITPEISGRILDGDDTYQIVNIEQVKTGDTAIIYKLQLRK